MTGQPERLSAAQARALFRAGLRVPTAIWAPGYAQSNRVALPRAAAGEFRQFALANPGPCPLLDVTEPGRTATRLAPGADLRTDLPAYRVWADGRCVAEPAEVTGYWRDDLVTFLLGCSFTFERALLAAGVPVRHVEQGVNVPMFRTSRQWRPAGRFAGPLVVSMRPVPADLVARAAEVTAGYPAAHGAPVHAGDPAGLGITDITRPDFGDPVALLPGDMPVFWACGVTPQVALTAARLALAITHAPGHMLITDRPEAGAPPATGR
ncbi:MAG: putative hydro-lyase [Streptosporangiaceae bacterium]